MHCPSEAGQATNTTRSRIKQVGSINVDAKKYIAKTKISVPCVLSFAPSFPRSASQIQPDDHPGEKGKIYC